VKTLARLNYAVIGRKGAALLAGNIGSGKSLLSKVFIRQLPEKDFDISVITNPTHAIAAHAHQYAKNFDCMLLLFLYLYINGISSTRYTDM